MKYTKPALKHKDQVMRYKKTFIENNEDMAGTSYLQDYDSYEEWVQFVQDNEKEETKHTEVAASVFLAIRETDDKLVGVINIRHDLNDYLFNYGGHIGYSVIKDERRKGYAKDMLEFALKECKALGMEKVLVTCDATNIGSSKTIKACGGVLENEVDEDGQMTQRYWIKTI